MTGILRGLWQRLRGFHDAQVELNERWLLRNRPWSEDVLHWCVTSVDGDAEPVLHGHIAPSRWGPRPVTRSGWCLGYDREVARLPR